MIRLPLSELSLFSWLGLLVSDESEAEFLLTPPEGSVVEAEWERTLLKVHHEGASVRLDTQPRGGRTSAFRRLGIALKNGRVPEGTMWSFRTQHESMSCARLEFSGWIREGELHIENREVPDDLLISLLALCRECEGGDAVTASSPEIAAEAADAAREMMSYLNVLVVQQGLSLTAQRNQQPCADFIDTLGRAVLLHTPRFVAALKLEEAVAAEREARKQVVQASQSMQSLVAQAHQNILIHAGVKLGELVYRGELGTYHQARLEDLDHVEDQDVADVDAQMAGLGFVPLGTVTSTYLEGAIARGYKDSRGDCYGMVTSGPKGHFVREFYSWLSDGWSLTTSTFPKADDRQICKIVRRPHPGATTEELLKFHREHLEDRAAPRPCGGLAEFAESLDDYMRRFLKGA